LVEELGKKSNATNDDLERLISELALLGKSPAEIEKLTKASVALSEVTGQSLDAAFTQLNATLSGSAGKLEKLIPGLGNLTKAQLENGDAIQYVIDKMAVYTDSVADSYSVKIKNLDESFKNLKQTIGEGWAESFKPMIDAATIAFNKLASIVATSNISKKIDSMTGSLAGGGDLKGLQDLRAEVGQEAFAKAVENYLKGTLGGLNANKAMVAQIKALAAMPDSKQPVDPRGFAPTAGVSLWDTGKPAGKPAGTSGNPIEINPYNIADGFESAFNALDYGNNFSPLTGGGSDYGIPTSAGVAPVGVELDPYNLADGFEAAFNAMDFANNFSPLTGAGSFMPQTSKEIDAMMIEWGNQRAEGTQFEQTGIKAYKTPTEERLQGATDLFKPLTDQFSGLIEPVSMIMQMLDPISLILSGFFDTIGPAITTIIKPLFDALKGVGQILAEALFPILNAIAPIFSVLATVIMSVVTPLINLLMPAISFVSAILSGWIVPQFKALAVVIEVLMSPIRYLGDLFAWVGKVISDFGWNVTHWFDPRNTAGTFKSDAFSGLGDRIQAIWNDTGSTVETTPIGSSSGGGASYTAQRDITVNVYLGTLVGSDGIDEFTYLIRDKLTEFGALGR
jgi:hypothetical protein